VRTLTQGFKIRLEVAAQGGSSWVVERILAQGYQEDDGDVSGDGLVDINDAQSRFGGAVVIASSRGHRAIVALLLDQGAGINIVDGDYDSLGCCCF